MTPGEIDDWVRAEAPNGGLYRLDDAAIAAISPELLLTQDLCRVCAVPTGDVDAALARIGCPATVVTLEPQRLDEVIASVGDVADAAGEPDRGRAGGRAERPARRRSRSGRRPPAGADARARVAGPAVHRRPLGPGRHRRGRRRGAARRSPAGDRGASTWDEVLRTDPEVVVLAPCGMPSVDALAQADELVPAELLRRRVVAVDLARPGPRLVDCVEALAAVLHPGAGLPSGPSRPRALTARTRSGPPDASIRGVLRHLSAVAVARPARVLGGVHRRPRSRRRRSGRRSER